MAIVLVATLLVLFATHAVPASVHWRDFTWLRRWQEQVGSNQVKSRQCTDAGTACVANSTSRVATRTMAMLGSERTVGVG